MPVTFVGAGAWASGTTEATPGLVTGATTGDLMLLFVESALVPIPPPTGWSPFPNISGTAGATSGGLTTVTMPGASWTTNQWVGQTCYYYTPGGTLETYSTINSNTSNQLSINTSFFTNPAGGTIVISGNGQGTAGSGLNLAVFYRWCNLTESPPIVVGSNHVTANIVVYRGPTAANLFTVRPTFGQLGIASTSATWPSITTIAPNTWILTACGVDLDSGNTALLSAPTNPNVTGSTIRINRSVNTGGGGGIFLADMQMATPGVSGTFASTGVSTTRVYLTIPLSAQGPAAALQGTAGVTATASASALTEAPWVAAPKVQATATGALTTQIVLGSAASVVATATPAVLMVAQRFLATAYSSTIAYIATGALLNSRAALRTADNNYTNPATVVRSATYVHSISGSHEVCVAGSDTPAWVARAPSGRNGPVAFWNPVTQRLYIKNTSTSYILTSDDGVQQGFNNTSATNVQTGTYLDDGRYVVYNSSIWATSVNGTTWTTQTALPFSVTPPVIRVIDGGFFWTRINGSNVATSTDGLTWTQHTTVNVSADLGTAVSRDKIVIFGSATNVTRVSTNGTTWTNGTAISGVPNSSNNRLAGTFNNLFVLATLDSGFSSIRLSTDGLNWSTLPGVPPEFLVAEMTVSGFGPANDDCIAVIGYNSTTLTCRTLFVETRNGAAGVVVSASAPLLTAKNVFVGFNANALEVSNISTAGSYPYLVFHSHAKSPTTGTIVSVGKGLGQLAYRSTDGGRTYTLPSGSGTACSSVAVNSSGVFVAINHLGMIYTSTNDGATFTNTLNSSTVNTDRAYVYFFAGLFVARAMVWNGFYYTSADGSVWTQRFLPPNDNDPTPPGAQPEPRTYWWGPMIVQNDTLFISNTQTTKVISSTDGTNWTTAIPSNTIEVQDYVRNLVWFKGNYYYCSYSTFNSRVSTYRISATFDRATVVEVDSPSDTDFYALPSMFVVDDLLAVVFYLNSGAFIVRYTSDGTNWLTETFGTIVPTTVGAVNIIDFPDGGLGVGPVRFKKRGAKAKITMPVAEPANFAANALVTASASAPGFAVPAALISDTYNFSVILPGITAGAASTAYGLGMYVSMDAINDRLYQSTDGENWSFIQGSGIVEEQTLFVGSRFYRLPLGSSTTCATSSNGTTWTTLSFGEAGVYRDIAFGNGIYLLIVNDGTTWTSSNGTTFVGRLDLFGDALTRVVFAFGKFYLSAYGILNLTTTTDGVSWSGTGVIFTQCSRVELANNKLFVFSITERDYRISTDGDTWSGVITPAYLGPNDKFFGRLYFDGYRYYHFASFSNQTRYGLLVSDDGVSWWEQSLPNGSQYGVVVPGAFGRILLDTSSFDGPNVRQFALSKRRAVAIGNMASGVAFNASATVVASTTAALTTQIRLAAQALGNASPTANLRVGVFFAASATSEATALTYFAGDPAALVSTPSATAAASASLTTAIRFAAAPGVLATASSSLTVITRFVGESTVTASGSGVLSTAIRMASLGQGAVAGNGSLTTSIRLNGSLPGSVSTSGWLLTKVQFASSMSFSVVATLTYDRFIAGAATGVASTAAALGTGIRLLSSQALVSVASASLLTQKRFASAAPVVASSTGGLSTQIRLASYNISSAQAAATITVVPSSLFASALAVVGRSGDLTVQTRFAAALTSTAAASSSITTEIRAAALAASVTSTAADLTTKMWLLPNSPRRVHQRPLRRRAQESVDRRSVAVVTDERVGVPAERNRVFVSPSDVTADIKSEII